MIKHLSLIGLLQLGLMVPAFPMPSHPSRAIVQDTDMEWTGSFLPDGEWRNSRTPDSSAKGGNADETNHAVPNLGTTSGGPAD